MILHLTVLFSLIRPILLRADLTSQGSGDCGEAGTVSRLRAEVGACRELGHNINTALGSLKINIEYQVVLQLTFYTQYYTVENDYEGKPQRGKKRFPVIRWALNHTQSTRR